MPKSKSDRPAKFGWCITDHHEDCRVEISDGIKCGCDCHDEQSA